MQSPSSQFEQYIFSTIAVHYRRNGPRLNASVDSREDAYLDPQMFGPNHFLLLRSIFIIFRPFIWIWNGVSEVQWYRMLEYANGIIIKGSKWIMIKKVASNKRAIVWCQAWVLPEGFRWPFYCAVCRFNLFGHSAASTKPLYNNSQSEQPAGIRPGSPLRWTFPLISNYTIK